MEGEEPEVLTAAFTMSSVVLQATAVNLMTGICPKHKALSYFHLNDGRPLLTKLKQELSLKPESEFDTGKRWY